MFKIRHIFFVIIALSFLVSCEPSKRMIDASSGIEIRLTNKLKVNNDSLEIKIHIQFPKKWMQKHKIIKLSPWLIIGDEKYNFSDVLFQGEKVKHQEFPVISFETGLEYIIQDKIPFSKKSDSAKIHLWLEFCGDTKGKILHCCDWKIKIRTLYLEEIK